MPTARHAFAGIADSETFAAAWRPAACQLGIDPDTGAFTVLGDGAGWIWNRAAEQFPNAAGVLDVFHAVERLSDTTKALFGEGTELSQCLSARGHACCCRTATRG